MDNQGTSVDNRDMSVDNLEMSVDGVAKAGRGNRTLVFSLEGYCSTIELHPQWQQGRTGECRIRTCEGIAIRFTV